MADMHKDSTKIPLDESSRHGPKFDELEMAQGPFILSQSQVLRKLDLRVLPMLLITYGLQFLDKALLGYAAAYTFREDTHLHGQQYSWVSSIFYFGFLVFEYPLTGFLHSFTASRYLGSFIIMWGLCVVMTNFADSFAGLMVSRFILGALESVMAPSFVAITAQWYSREAQPLRQVIWFSGTPLFGIFGGLLSYALGHAHTVVASWRLLYIIFGSVTVIWGIIFTLLFPSSPQKASFLSEEERAFVMLTSQQQHSTFDAKWKWSQVREALLDVKSYIFFLIGVANTIPSGALSNFSSLLIKGFGFTALQTQLLGIPSHAIQLVSLLVSGLIATRTKNMRLIIMSACVIPSIIATVLVYTLSPSNRWGRVVSVWIIYTNSASLAVSFSVIGGNVAGYTKKTTVTVLLFVGYCLGNIIAPQFFRENEAHRGYPTAIIAMITSFAFLFISPLTLRYLYSSENRRRDRQSIDGERQDCVREERDLTDIQDKRFRYAL